VVLVRQKPGSAKGVVFLTIEDETGIANLVLWPPVALAFRREVMTARLLLVGGRVQKSAEGIGHLVAERLDDWSDELRRLTDDPFSPPLARADEVDGSRHPREIRVVPKARDFH
jgi:error-prone DNA polymerase